MNRFMAGLGVLALTAVVSAAPNQTGVNVNYLFDSDNVPLLADVMRTYRTVNASGSSYYANDAVLDANGWATTDAWYFLGDPAALKHGDGTYGLKFTGQATISLGRTGNDGTIVNQTYDPVTNTTTASLQMKTNVDLSDLRFTNTQRTATSGANTGVADVQVMRPTTPGGSTPYSFGTTFTNQTKEIAGKTNALRFMDYLATNNNIQANWADRVKPTSVKLNPTMANSSRGKGGPLELAVQLGNETGRDVWINIPAGASDDYITKVAQLIKYGSDGANPYTSPQANPAFKPLAQGLNVYLEYSNETWNSGFNQYKQISALAKAKVAAEQASGTAGPMTYGTTTTTQEAYLVERYNAIRTKEMTDLFANVFGQSEINKTVRTILAWQYGNGSDTANQAMTVLDGYYNNAKGNYVANPKAPNSYIYGGGSAMYYSPQLATADMNVDGIVTTPVQQMQGQYAKMQKDLAYTTTFGLKRVAYEGGLSLDPGGSSETATSLPAKLAALADPRMQQLVVTNHNQWTNAGGELLVYYFATDQYKFAMTDEYYNTNTPKLNALAQLQGQNATRDYVFGTPLSRTTATTVKGGKFDLSGKSGAAFDGAMGLGAGDWTSYLINIPEGGEYVINASYKTFNGQAVSFKLLLGGAVIGDYATLLSDAKYANTPGVYLTLPSGITSLRVLMNNTTSGMSLASVSFNPVPFANPNAGGVPEPATVGLLGVAGVGLLRRRRVTH